MKAFTWIAGVITELRENVSDLTVGSAMALVAFSSGFISYTHISALTLAEGQNWKTAHLMPACIDGQIVIGSFYFMDGKTRWQKTAGLVFGVLPGIAESLYANWESGIVHGLLAAGWATVPAQAFACSTFLFERWLHNRRRVRPAAARRLAPVFSPVSVLPALHPVLQEAPRDVVTPVEPPQERPVPAWTASFGPLLVAGPHQPLNASQKQARKTPVAAGPDTRLPLPDDPQELAAAVAGMSRNDLFRTYQISKHKADQLRKEHGIGQQDSEEVASDAA